VELKVNGIAILNGAQTVGAIGSLSETPDDKLKIQARFVKCENRATQENIKKYNNTQNKIEAQDYRSNDSTQERLSAEFEQQRGVCYRQRRGEMNPVGFKNSKVISSVVAGQILTAFHGRPELAYHKKTELWEKDELYTKYFNTSTTASHIIFVHSLYESIKQRKLELVKKTKSANVVDIEREELNFYQTRGTLFIFLTAIANSLSVILDFNIANKFNLSFTKKSNYKTYVEVWRKLLECLYPFTSKLAEGVTNGAIRLENADKVVNDFVRYIQSTRSSNLQN